MEALASSNHQPPPEGTENEPSNQPSSFIEANTQAITLQEIESKCIVPVFSKDNETTISHVQFIETCQNVAQEYFSGTTILKPQIRVSHPCKGRIPEARNKPSNELQEHEKTLYYERMAFTLEIPEISREIMGNRLNLVVGGVKSYSEDNLFNRKGSNEHFKVFIGFQNKVCLNLCVWTDGLKEEIKVNNLQALAATIHELVSGYNAKENLLRMLQFAESYITEHQFAQLIGKTKLYNYLPTAEKKVLPAFQFLDCHINAIAEDYYSNKSFCRGDDGSINLWNLYNLFTGAAKNSYIDKFLSRGVNASQFISSLSHAIQEKERFWFIE